MESKHLSIQTTAQFILEMPPVYEGPLSRIYRAQDLNLKRTVGIKEVEIRDLTQVEKSTLRSEINVWCDYASKSSRLPQILNAFTDKDRFYIVMQWIDGRTLRDLIMAEELVLSQKISLAIQLCDALAPIHRSRKQHRDLKPENIQVTRERKLYLMDFNISAAIPHAGVGTEGYLAPECCGLSNQTGTSRVDVFAIGVILYEMFTGSIPVFGLDYLCNYGDTEWQVFVRPSEKNPDLPAKLDEIVERCMKLQWKDRYPDAAAISRALKSLINRRY